MMLHFNDRVEQLGENDSRHGARKTSRFLRKYPIVSHAWNIQARNSVGEITGAVRAPRAAALYACERRPIRPPCGVLARALPRLRRKH